MPLAPAQVEDPAGELTDAPGESLGLGQRSRIPAGELVAVAGEEPAVGFAAAGRSVASRQSRVLVGIGQSRTV